MPAATDPTAPFRWQDGDRLIRFGRGTIGEAAELLEPGYALLTTPRALAAAPALGEAATSVHEVPTGRVDAVAAGLRDSVDAEHLVALGGGRVIDVAKALASAAGGGRVAAVPTTLSAAEMTRMHRHAEGVAADTPRTRPALVISDPDLCASQPEPALAASAANALAHAAEAPLTPLASPVATLAALEGGRLLAGAWRDGAVNRDALALGALLSGYASDIAVFGLHHVMSQTIVRVAGIGHGPANALLLPHTLRALDRRFPEAMRRFGAALGGDPPSAAAALAARTGTVRLRDLGVTAETLGECADVAAARPDLAMTPPPADRVELLALYEAAW